MTNADNAPQTEPIVEQAHKLYVKSKVYRVIAGFLAVMGFAMTIVVYNQLPKTATQDILQNPFTVFILITPFFPAAVIQLLGGSARKKAIKLVEQKKLDLQSKSQ